MKRFRITILAVCLILLWLGSSDLSTLLRNPEPYQVSLSELEQNGPEREWLSVSGGFQDLLQAINMSGSVNIDSFLVPLKSTPQDSNISVWFETRDPAIIDALKTYYFLLDTDQQRSDFVRQNAALFSGATTVTGMTADNLVADNNRNKLVKLLGEMNMPVSEQTIFISEGKQPGRWRGIFFLAMGLIGLVKIFFNYAGKGKK